MQTSESLTGAIAAMTSAQTGWLVEHFTAIRDHLVSTQPEVADVCNEFLCLLSDDLGERPQRARAEIDTLHHLMAADSMSLEDLPDADSGWTGCKQDR
jgi:hypothetical protein